VEPWLETGGIVAVTLFGLLTAIKLRRTGGRLWVAGYLTGLVLIVLLAASRVGGAMEEVPGLAALATGRIKFVVLALGVTLGMTTPLSRLRYRLEKAIVCVIMALTIVWFSVLPFLVPGLIKKDLAAIATHIGPGGVCLQSTNYTCGPAAAVTALNKLGFRASEGQLAILARSNPITGTLPGSLCAALKNRYANDGLECFYRTFNSVGELENTGITLVVVKDAFLLDHYVAVLDVSDGIVTLADPALGHRLVSRERFEKIWRFCGIVLAKKTT
jgi:hypothetical protein